MPELLKALYVFQSLDLAFLRDGMCAVLVVLWPGVGDSRLQWGGAVRGWIVSVLPPPPVGLVC